MDLLFIRFFSLLAPVLMVMACSAPDPQMSSEDFQKPENHAALEKTIAGCLRVLPSDSRAANCQSARNAKFALDTAEIARTRRAQAVERESADRASSLSSTEASQDLAQLKNDPKMSAEDFRRPENHAAMERTLEACGGALAQDTRAPNCRNARIAKLMLDTAEIQRIRRAQALEREGADRAGGVSKVDKSPVAPLAGSELSPSAAGRVADEAHASR